MSPDKVVSGQQGQVQEGLSSLRRVEVGLISVGAQGSIGKGVNMLPGECPCTPELPLY